MKKKTNHHTHAGKKVASHSLGTAAGAVARLKIDARYGSDGEHQTAGVMHENKPYSDVLNFSRQPCRFYSELVIMRELTRAHARRDQRSDTPDLDTHGRTFARMGEHRALAG